MRQNPASYFEESINATIGFPSSEEKKWGPNYLSKYILYKPFQAV
jgi:hypothetical protein